MSFGKSVKKALGKARVAATVAWSGETGDDIVQEATEIYNLVQPTDGFVPLTALKPALDQIAIRLRLPEFIDDPRKKYVLKLIESTLRSLEKPESWKEIVTVHNGVPGLTEEAWHLWGAMQLRCWGKKDVKSCEGLR